MLDAVGLRLPNHKVREIVNEIKNNVEIKEEFLSKSCFEKVKMNY